MTETREQIDLGERREAYKDRGGLAGAGIIVGQQGLRRQAPVLVGLFVSLLFESIGLAAIIPILALAGADPAAEKNKLQTAILEIFDQLGIEQPSTLTLLGVLLASSVIKGAAMTGAMSYAGFMISRFATQARLRLIDKVLDARWLYFTAHSGASISNAIVAETRAASRAYRSALLIFVRLGFAMIYVAITFAFGWQIGVGATLLSVALGFAIYRLVVMSRRARREQIGAAHNIIKQFSELMVNLKPLKAMYRYQHIAKRLTRQIRGMRRIARKLVLAQQIGSELFQLSTMLLLIAGFVLAVKVYNLQVGDFLALAIVAQRLMQATSQYFLSMLAFDLAVPSYWFLRWLEKDIDAARETYDGGIDPKLGDGIHFEKVTFAYGKKAILDHVDLTIQAGQLTAVIGESGAGKTTLVDLMLGLLSPQSGNIVIGETNLWDVDILKWRNAVGYVGQELLLFNDSIAANVTLRNPQLGEADVIDALKLAGAWDFVTKLPGGIQAQVGERGLMLSGGQRQRIALARALAHHPQLLILDEATSALDPATEAEICRTVADLSGKYTIVAITHRPAWLDRADHIYRVQDGAVTRIDELHQIASP